ncbi:MAG: tetratricopeptide repeat protein [Bryobacteraceae bacterium]|nr:tetratricopeptide repeat protein [Bryobacteraceae bacterium]
MHRGALVVLLALGSGADAQQDDRRFGPPPLPPAFKQTVELQVRVEGGGTPREPAYVELHCGRILSGFTDKSGFLLMTLPEAPTAQVATGEPQTWHGRCAVKAVFLPGYRSVPWDPLTVRQLGAGEGWSTSIANYRAPQKAREQYLAGLEAFDRSNWTEAEKRFRAAVRQYDAYASAWFQLGAVYQKTGRLQEARQAYEAALRHDRLFTRPYVQLAEMAAAAGNWAEAERLLGVVFPMNPIDTPLAYYYQAGAEMKKGRLDEAERRALEAVKYDGAGRHPDTRLLAGRIRARLGKRAEAILLLDEYLRLAPEAADAATVRQLREELSRQ